MMAPHGSTGNVRRLFLATVMIAVSRAFAPVQLRSQSTKHMMGLQASNDNEKERDPSRRAAMGGLTAGWLELMTSIPASAADGYQPAKRPTAYRVDSTIPPTLLPLSTAPKQARILADLGRGSGTDKSAIVVDTLNLNNILNKAVFGSISAISAATSSNRDESRSGPGYASFVCLGVPQSTTATDIQLADSLMTSVVKDRRKQATALALACLPLSVQATLDAYSKSGDEDALTESLTAAGLDRSAIDLYRPLLSSARRQSLDLLAAGVESQDVAAVRKEGLQNVDVERRGRYVLDSQGFISSTNDPRYKLYTDRSLFKDFDGNGSAGNFFAQRILVHEAAASTVAQYAVTRPESLVVLIANAPDLRYLNGINGRIPRICRFLSSESKVTPNAVTTILLNPTAEETLSKTKRLRLEIGTGPDTLDYQTKVADYLWFSSSPKVSLIPRLMEG